MSTDFWDERYSGGEFAYGQQANEFLAEVVDKLPQGPVLCLGAGEGRNAVYLAGRRGPVTAIDQSAVGLQKARELAAQSGLELKTEVADLGEYEFGDGWSVITSIWAHVPPDIRARVLGEVTGALKPGGAFLLEAYTPQQVGRGTGGPPDPTFTVTLAELEERLQELQFVIAREIERDVREGEFHAGMSSVVQLLAIKPA